MWKRFIKNSIYFQQMYWIIGLHKFLMSRKQFWALKNDLLSLSIIVYCY